MGLPINCTLWFDTLGPSPATPAFDDFGNPVIGKATAIVTASMSRKSMSQASQNGDASIDGQTVIMEGRSAEPKIIDMSTLPREAKAEITDPVTRQVLKGNAVFGLPTQSKFRAVTQAMGTKLEFEFFESEGR